MSEEGSQTREQGRRRGCGNVMMGGGGGGTYCKQRRHARPALDTTVQRARRRNRPFCASVRVSVSPPQTGEAEWVETNQSWPPRMILCAPTSLASAAMSSHARFRPYRLMGFGGTFGASWARQRPLLYARRAWVRSRLTVPP